VIEPSDALTVRSFAPGEALDAESGVFIADAATGVGELWSIREERDPQVLGPTYQSSPDGRFITARVGNTFHIADRATGAGFQWDERLFRMQGLPDSEGRVLFRPDGSVCRFYAIEFRAAEAALLASISLEDEATECGELNGLFSPDGTHLFVHARQGRLRVPGSSALYLVELANAKITRLADLDERAALTELHRLPEHRGMLVIERTGGRDASLVAAPGITIARYGWDGAALGERAIPVSGDSRTSDSVFLSGNGRWIAWQEHLPFGIPFGLGRSEHWPLVAVADLASGEVLFRMVRASMSNGTGFTGWLADSSALVIATVDGYAVASTTGGRLAPLGFGTVSHFEPRPIAAPDDAGLFAFDGRVVDRRGEVVRPVAAAAEAWGPSWGVLTTYAWGASSELLRFSSIPPLGRDFGPGGLSMPTLEARVQTPPFSDEVRLRVTGTVTHLNLRAEPSADAQLIGEILEGEAVLVVDALGEAAVPCGGNEGCSVAYDSELPGERWWLHVRTEDGAEGWAASEFLDWAD
jgi:hypothetical protein